MYRSLCNWRRAYQTPEVASFLNEEFNTVSRRKIFGKGPLTLLVEDFGWLGCEFDPATGVLKQTQTGMQATFSEPDKYVFQHQVREMIRHVLLRQLESKHSRWDGVAQADLKRTTALVRKMDPTQPGRTALMRVLSNARAVPHHLFKQGVLSTPACPYCACEDADVHHIMFHCPRFCFLREDWPEYMFHFADWPSCAQRCLIATKTLPPHVLNNWSTVQMHISYLLETWMSFQRNPDEIQAVTMISHQIDCAKKPPAAVGLCCLQQEQVHISPQDRLPLQWNKPSSNSAFNTWGGNDTDFHVLFSFWVQWSVAPFVGKAEFSTWMEVFLVFLQQGVRLPTFFPLVQQ